MQKGIIMSSITIYMDGSSDFLEDICRNKLGAEVNIKGSVTIQDMETEKADAAVICIPSDELKKLSMIMKFPLPVLLVCDDVPENIIIRGEAYDFVTAPLNEYEIVVRLKNLMKIKMLKDKISDISTTDDLTGLHNRKYLLERLDSEISRARRYHSSVSCVLFDIDFFKVINDMYGYEWGDILLKQIGEMLANLARKEDIVTRYGDEEFMAVLPDTSEDRAFIFAERFRKDVERMSFIPAGETEKHPIKISGGIASYPCLDQSEESANTLIRYAEHALYNAKKRGKNKIILFSQVNMEY